MPIQDLLETLIEEAFDVISRSKNGVPRLFKFPDTPNLIKVAVGMRRSGKSYFLYQTINQLLDKGISYQNILMINFEDERLLPMTAKEMGALLDAFYTLYPNNHNQTCYFFLDEVQNVPGWQQVVRRFFDTKNIQIYITGSSAKLLSKEIATSLRGRASTLEIWPYNFDEFLSAHNEKLPKGTVLGKKTMDFLQQQLKKYFTIGGFPGVQHMESNIWRDTLQSYVDTVILRDIVERYNISNITLLKYLINTLLTNAATQFSINKFYNDIKSQGYKVGKDTIYNYISYIEDTFLTFSIPLYTESVRAKQNISKKIYAIDNGLINSNSIKHNNLYGKLFENQIYLDLRREGKTIYFYNTKDGYEIDFITVDKAGNHEILQVAWDVSDSNTLMREQRALLQAEKELGFSGRIISLREYFRP